MDGIKTGYTRASGFNLLSSVGRGGHRIVSVVLGGRTAAARDRVMASLIEAHIEEAAPTRVASAVPPSPVEEAAPTPASLDDETADTAPADDTPDVDQGPSLIAPTMAVPPARIARPALEARTPHDRVANPAPLPVERPRPAFIAGTPKLDPSRQAAAPSPVERRRLALDGSTNGNASGKSGATVVALATSTPSTIRDVLKAATGPVARPESRPKPSEDASAGSADRPVVSGHEWFVQVGATDAVEKASDLLARARNQERSALASARSLTEKVRKGDTTLYRARFAGLDTDEAEAACKALKRSGFACFAAKD